MKESECEFLRQREVELMAILIEGEATLTENDRIALLTELEDIEDALDAEEARQNPELLHQDLQKLLGEEEGTNAIRELKTQGLVRRWTEKKKGATNDPR